METPKLLEQTRGLDFGAGFYLTTDKTQAVRFSEIVVNRRKSGSAIVNIYEFDMKLAEKTMSILKFAYADVAWLRFVVDNRLKTYKGVLYDIVIGAVANDTVMPTIQAFMGGFLNEEATLITLKTSKLTNQICIKSKRALSLLRFMGVQETKGGIGNG